MSMKSTIIKIIDKKTGLSDRLIRLEENVRSLNTENESLRGKVNELSQQNAALKKLSSDIEYLRFKLSKVEREGAVTSADHRTGSDSSEGDTVLHREETKEQYSAIDYFDFENHFRGSIEEIKERQKCYLPYFSDKKKVLDLGCGRGEFLQLMKENGIPAVGVDLYADYVDFCNQMQHVEAVQADAISYLKDLKEKVDGIFACQLVEHLSIEQIVTLSEYAYEKLEDHGCFIIETPNPLSLFIFSHSFYMDPSHVKPVHPYTMKYVLEKAGFKEVEIIFTEGSKPNMHIPVLAGTGVENIEEFNLAMKTVEENLFGSQDYAIVARKGRHE